VPKPKLSPNDIDHVVNLLTSWRGKLTWDLLVDKVTAVLGRPYSRQALDAHDSINVAFGLAKKRVREAKPASRGSPETSRELATEQDRVETLRAEVAVLKQQRDAFLETFAIWLYNARNRGLTERELNQPLPAVERHRSAEK
jgi:hypothetical protein